MILTETVVVDLIGLYPRVGPQFHVFSRHFLLFYKHSSTISMQSVEIMFVLTQFELNVSLGSIKGF